LRSVDAGAARGGAPALVEGLLVGLYAETGATLGIGRVRSCDADAGRVVVETPVAAARIARLVPGRAVWNPGG
jgi:polynucleotide 5'-kinase involved in rRNA processing